MTEEEEWNRFEQIVSKLREFFPDHLVVAKHGKNGMMWKHSDINWSVGAMTRLLQKIKDQDFFDAEMEAHETD